MLIWNLIGVHLSYEGCLKVQRSEGTYAVLFELNERKSRNPSDDWSKNISKVHDNQLNSLNPILCKL